MHATGGIRTRNPNKRAAADPRFSTVYFNKITQEETAHLLVRSDKRTSHLTQKGRWNHIIVPNLHRSLQNKGDDGENNEELQRFSKNSFTSHTHILLREFRAKLEMQGIFKFRIGEDNLDEIINIIVTQQDTLPYPKCNVEYYNASTLKYT
jgi:hypothetical protein